MQLLKQLLPASWKLRLRLLNCALRDLLSGRLLKFARKYYNGPVPAHSLSITQAIPFTDNAASKIRNLTLASERLHNLVIEPGQLFSFWKIVGAPTAVKGYQKSRSIVAGQLMAETGGGLCQLSGLIYYLALKAGLRMVEHHAHSLDIYTDAERFTPLGSDATVAYGYKDLRFLNSLDYPLVLRFTFATDQLTGSLCCNDADLPATDVQFLYNPVQNGVEVTTMRNNEIITTHYYRRRLVH